MKKNIYLLFITFVFLSFFSCNKDKNIIDVTEIVDIQEDVIDVLNSSSVPEASMENIINNCIQQLLSNPDISAAYLYGCDEIIINYKSGATGIIYFTGEDVDTEDKKTMSVKSTMKNTKGQDEEVVITNNKVLIWDWQDVDARYAVANDLKNVFNNCNEIDFDVVVKQGDECSFQSLNNLTQYGFVYICTHGGAKPNSHGEEISWILTREKVTGSELNNGDLTSERKIIVTLVDVSKEYINNQEIRRFKSHSTWWAISDEYISKYVTGSFNNPSVVFVQACHSFDNDNLRNIFINEKNASCYLGYTNSVMFEFGYNKAIEFATNMLQHNLNARDAYLEMDVTTDDTHLPFIEWLWNGFSGEGFNIPPRSQLIFSQKEIPTYFGKERYIECSELNKRWSLQYCMFNSNNSTEFEYSSSSLTFMGTGTPSDVVSDIHIDFQISRCNNLIAGTYTPFNISDTSDVNNWENHNYPMRFLTGSYKNWYGAAVGYVPYGSTVSVNSNNYTLTGGNINVQYNNDLRTVSFSFTDENGHYYTGRWKD